MWILLSAIATASFLGSMHCVGMCGPLALWAGGAAEQRRRSEQTLATTTYHLGRLTTYAIVGLLAGYLGSLADLGGNALGIQLVAARLAGVAMIAAGLYQLNAYAKSKGFSLARFSLGTRSGTSSGGNGPAVDQASPPHAIQPPKPGLITGLLIRLRPIIFKQPVALRGLLTGLLTVLLPCGWLYIFALAAAGTGNAISGALVMAAFWLGSVPALVGLVAGSAWFGTRVRPLVPILGAIVLLIGGGYTAMGRGFADMSTLIKMQPVKLETSTADSETPRTPNTNLHQQIDVLTSTKLPCCEHCLEEVDKLEEADKAANTSQPESLTKGRSDHNSGIGDVRHSSPDSTESSESTEQGEPTEQGESTERGAAQ